MLANRRKAYASKGDDTTLTRFVKLPHAKKRKTVPMPADATGTRFPGTLVRPSDQKISPTMKTQLAVSGHSNTKIGRDVRKSRLRGYWIYPLALEERKTCPASCLHWETCYGNASPFMKRIDHTDPMFMPLLDAEINRLTSIKGRVGVLYRLHELGDFFSVKYVEFWRAMLHKYPTLAIYGYTAREPGTPIGDAVDDLYDTFNERAMIRRSNSGYYEMSTVSIKTEADCPPNTVICPEQTGKTKACATCGLCWGTTKNIAFLEH